MLCKYCNSNNTIKRGAKNKVQAYYCKDCLKKFTEKTAYIHIETFDERGRYISYDEFKWIMNWFKDRYDPRRLSFALAYTTGLRYEDACHIRIRSFAPDFSYIKMSQNKAHIRKKDGIIRATSKPKFVPLPTWLSEDLKNYVGHRLMLGHYFGEKIEEGLFFPTLRKHHLRHYFNKMRENHSGKAPWLKDLWKKVTAYDKEGNILWQKPMYRVATHAGRANYVTAAYIVSDRDLEKTRVLSGHDHIKDVSKYVRVNGIMEAKMRVKEEFMDGLTSIQRIPVSKNQRKLSDFVT